MDIVTPTGRRAASPWQSLADALRRIAGRWRQRRELRRHLAAIEQLDEATLRDIALRRSEAASYWAEAAGRTEPTRLRLARPRTWRTVA